MGSLFVLYYLLIIQNIIYMKKFNLIFVETLLTYNNQKFDVNVIENINTYASNSIYKMPDFMRNGVYLMSIVFNYIYLLRYLKRFEDLDINKRLNIINIIKSKNLIMLSLLVRLYENLILNKYFEYDRKI
jgi:hypothetical protein